MSPIQISVYHLGVTQEDLIVASKNVSQTMYSLRIEMLHGE
jgi:hypothetical protein